MASINKIHNLNQKEQFINDYHQSFGLNYETY